MASSMVACMLRRSLRRTRFTTRCTRPAPKRRSSITVCWASRREEASDVVTTTARSAPHTARENPYPRPAGASSRHRSKSCRTRSSRAAISSSVTWRPRSRTGAVRRNRPGRRGCSTTAALSEQRPWATSVKSIRAWSDRPSARSRFRSPTSQSTHSTRSPCCDSAAPTPAVSEVLPVPPLPDTTAIHCPRWLMAHAPSFPHRPAWSRRRGDDRIL